MRADLGINNVTHEAKMSKMAPASTVTFGAVDILINNAGFNKDRYLTEMTETG